MTNEEVERFVLKHAADFPHPVLAVTVIGRHVFIVTELWPDLVKAKALMRYALPENVEDIGVGDMFGLGVPDYPWPSDGWPSR